MISFSSLSFEGSLQTESLLSSFFGADIKLRYLEFLEAPCAGCSGGRLKVILDFSLAPEQLFHEKPRGIVFENLFVIWTLRESNLSFMF